MTSAAKRKRILAVAVLALAAGLLAAGLLAASIASRPFSSYQGYTGTKIVTVPPGTGALSAGRILASQGVLRSRVPFLIFYALGRSRRRTLKAGEYLFDRPLTPRQVYGKLVRGDVYYHLVVIPEGSDRFDMARIFRNQVAFNPEDFLQATADTGLIRELDPAAPSLEGYLFPDSYRFPASITPAGAVETMLARFRHVMGSEFPRDLNAQNLHRVLTLASLVEKETPNPAERAEIAGVFARRLQLGMLLECDPTVSYAARLKATEIVALNPAEAKISSDQLNSASPYNTYRYPGLPPGPICSPGAASIAAALHPAPGDALYFVSNLRGGHVFARTLAEHHRNVARYRRGAAEPRN